MLITLKLGKKCFSMSTTIQENSTCFTNLRSSEARYLIGNIGVVALIEEMLYLVIDNKYTKSWKPIKPMVNIYEYFLMPQCWRLNQHQHLLSNI